MKGPLQNVHPEAPTSYETTVDASMLNEDIHYGYRLFRNLLTQQKKYIQQLDEYEVENKNDEEEIAEKVTFTTINDNFNNGTYENITEVVTDIRIVLENCYRRNGFNHQISKCARSLELVLEQKLALLPRLLREKCTLSASNVHRKKEYLNQSFNGSRRRSQPLSESSETALMTQLKMEFEIVERERRKQVELAKRLEYEKLKEQLNFFEKEVITSSMLQEIRFCWELPCVGIYVYMLRKFMNINDFNYTEFEIASFFMEKSMLFRKIFSALLATPSQRQRMETRKPLSFQGWLYTLQALLIKWYKTADKEGYEYASEVYGFDKSFFQQLGKENPVTDEAAFLHLTLKQKMCILKALCETALNDDVSMCSSLAVIPILKRQDLYLGQDFEKTSYYFFPQFTDTDIRIYKKYHQSKLKKIKEIRSTSHVDADYELVAWDVDSLRELLTSFQKVKKSKNSHLFDLEQTIEALYEELKLRAESFAKLNEKGKMAIVKEYYAEQEQINDVDASVNEPVLSAAMTSILEKSNNQRGILTARAKRLLERNQGTPRSGPPSFVDNFSDSSCQEYTVDSPLGVTRELPQLINGFNLSPESNNMLTTVEKAEHSIADINQSADLSKLSGSGANEILNVNSERTASSDVDVAMSISPVKTEGEKTVSLFTAVKTSPNTLIPSNISSSVGTSCMTNELQNTCSVFSSKNTEEVSMNSDGTPINAFGSILPVFPS